MSGVREPAVVVDEVRRSLQRTPPETDVQRLFHGRGNCWPEGSGLIIDRYAETVRVGWHGEREQLDAEGQ